VSGARCAERASEAGARGRMNKVSGRPDNSDSVWERRQALVVGKNGIFCYQMTVRFEAFCAERFCFEDSRRCFLCGVRETKRCERS